MADQLIFTSSVRGIKPGASGYCTVLRSPGIRSALEQALEKISVFEHGRCNQGRMVCTYRKLEIRDKTYFVLSRISDAGKDYTGRTNFLAHHLAFTKEELPDMSPADLLLHWPSWCQEWAGDPREEPVDPGSFNAIITTKPPVRLWKEQAAGVDGAVKLASDTGTPFVVRLNSASDESLLQLIAEAFAVRAKFNKSSAYAWTTTFSVGLAVPGSAKSFKWLALRASDDYPLSGAGTVLDLDSTLAGAPSANEELIAIAREGQFRPTPKPIPLTPQDSPAERSIPIQGARTSQQSASPQKLRLGRRGPRHPSLPAGHATKARSKKKVVFAFLASVMVLVLSAAGMWFFQQKGDKPLIGENTNRHNFEGHFRQMVEYYYQRDSPVRPSDEEIKQLVRQLYVAQDSSGINLSEEAMLQRMSEVDLDSLEIYDRENSEQKKEAEAAFEWFLDRLAEVIQKDKKSAIAKSGDVPVPVEIPKYIQHSSGDTVSVSNGKVVSSKDATTIPEEPLNLNQYEEIILRGIGEKAEVKTNLNATIQVSYVTNNSTLLSANQFVKSSGMAMDAKSINDPRGGLIVINEGIPNQTPSYAISIDLDDPALILIIGKDWPMRINLGTFQLAGSSADEAIELLEAVFKPGKLKMHLIDEDGIFYEAAGSGDDSSATSIGAKPLNYDLIDAMVKDADARDTPEKLLVSFEKWVSKKIISDIESRVKMVDEEFVGKMDERLLERFKKLLGNSYNKILNKIEDKNYRIESYFEAYQEQLDDLQKAKDEESDRSKHAPFDKAIDSLTRNHYSDGKIKITPEEKRTYVITWKNDTWSVKYWDKVRQLEVLAAKTADDLSSSLKQYSEYRNRIEAIQRERRQEQNTKKKYTEVSREWKSIEFKYPNGQVVATVEVK